LITSVTTGNEARTHCAGHSSKFSAGLEAGRVEIGLTTLDAQLAAIEQTGQRWFDSEVYRVRGELLLKLRQPDVAAAESAFMRAIEIARSQQTRTFELRAALSLAKLYKTTGRDQVASEVLIPALVGFNAGAEVPEVEEARRLLTMHSAYQPGDRLMGHSPAEGFGPGQSGEQSRELLSDSLVDPSQNPSS
jgi:hypothetical protein